MNVQSYIAIISIFAGNFAPRGWLFCQGQLLSISEYDVLFALIGTTYGGDGQVTFALPDLRGRVAVHAGQSPGMSNYFIGQTGGTETVTMTSNQVPPHSHVFQSATGNPGANSGAGSTDDPTNAVPAMVSGDNLYATATSGTALGPSIVNTNTPPAGGSQPFSILSPFLTMNYVICTEGIFPPQS